MTDGSFWFFVWRLPKMHSGKALPLLYGSLLPYLNNKPLHANLTPDTEVWRAAITSRDLSCARGVMECLHCCLLCSGLTPLQADDVMVLVRWMACKQVCSRVRARNSGVNRLHCPCLVRSAHQACH